MYWKVVKYLLPIVGMTFALECSGSDMESSNRESMLIHFGLILPLYAAVLGNVPDRHLGITSITMSITLLAICLGFNQYILSIITLVYIFYHFIDWKRFYYWIFKILSPSSLVVFNQIQPELKGNDACVICQADFDSNETVLKFSCGCRFAYHIECYALWCRGCVVCKQPVFFRTYFWPRSEFGFQLFGVFFFIIMLAVILVPHRCVPDFPLDA